MKQHDFNSPCVSTPQGQDKKALRQMTREEVLAARRGYEDALFNYVPSMLDADRKYHAAWMYPMPKKIVPREVTMSNGTTYRINKYGEVEWKPRGNSQWQVTKYVLDDYALVASLKDNPTCEVEA